jgi:VanZ family protein
VSIFVPGLHYRRMWFVAGLLITAVVVIASLLPAQQLPPVDVSDKIEHVIAFLVLAFWFGGVIAHRDFLYLALALVALGGGIEIAQGLMGLGRQSDLKDLGADTIGIAIGLAIAATPLGNWASLIDNRIAAYRAR